MLAPTRQLSLREEWALIDQAYAFTVVGVTHRVTFWGLLTAHDPIFSERTPQELQAHAEFLNMHVGHDPRVLRSAQALYGGRTWVGTVDGHRTVINAAMSGRLGSGGSFVESSSGEIFAAELVHMSTLQGLDLDSGGSPGGTLPVDLSHPLSFFDSPAADLASLYLPVAFACALLVGGQLLALGLHDGAYSYSL
jgi:hypothetical protein